MEKRQQRLFSDAWFGSVVKAVPVERARPLLRVVLVEFCLGRGRYGRGLVLAERHRGRLLVVSYGHAVMVVPSWRVCVLDCVEYPV